MLRPVHLFPGFRVRNIFLAIICLLFLSCITARSYGQVVINELGIAPSGIHPTTGLPLNSAGGGEFIELFNKGGCAVDISCYILVYSGTSNAGNANGWTTTIPSGTILQPCAFYLIGGAGNTIGATNVFWDNVATGGRSWFNNYGGHGNTTADLDLSTAAAKNSSKFSVPGNLNDARGQVSLFTSSGVPVWSVSYNTGNNTNTYPAVPNSTGCASITSIPDPSPATNNVNASFSAGGIQGIYLNSSGVYQTENNLSPGKANNVNGNTQFVCAPTITVASKTPDVCNGDTPQSTTLPYTATTNSPVTYSIVWAALPANSFVNITNAALPASPITITVPAGTPAGTYTGYLTVSNSSGIASCPVNTFTVTVLPRPTATLSGTQTICTGQSATLTVVLTGTPPWSITYTDGGSTFGSISGITSSPYTFTVTPTSTSTYFLVGITDANCTNLGSGSATITVNPAPPPPTVTVVNNCGSSTLTASGYTGSLLWSTGETTPSITVTAAGTYTVRQTVSGCTSGEASGVATPGAIVSAAPSVNITQPTCAVPTGTITVTSPAAGTGYAYSIDGTDYSNTSGVFAGLAPGPYNVTVKNASGCVSPVRIATITAAPVIPTATISGTATICRGQSTTISISVTGTAPWTIQYTDGTSTIPVNNLNVSPYTFTVSPTVNTTYTLVSVVDATCPGSVSGSATITVNPKPAPIITHN